MNNAFLVFLSTLCCLGFVAGCVIPAWWSDAQRFSGPELAIVAAFIVGFLLRPGVDVLCDWIEGRRPERNSS